MSLNAFKQVKICEMFELCDVVEHLRHFGGVVSGLLCILTKQHGLCCGKYLLKPPGNSISETLSVKMSLDASALKNLYLWCKFQSCLLFIISLLLKNFLTALETLHLSKGRKWFEPFNIKIILLHVFPHPGFRKGNKQNNRWAVQIILARGIPCANSWSQCLLWGAVYNDSLCRGWLEL